MALTTLTDDLEIISALDDEPNDVGGLTADQLKAKFDEAALALQTYLNTVLLPEMDAEHLPYLYGGTDTIKTTMEGIVAGAMPPGSVTTTQLSSSIYASQAQAEAGTENTLLMTPLRVAQAVGEQNKFVLLKSVTTSANATLLSVDVSDITWPDYAEVFIKAKINCTTSPSSNYMRMYFNSANSDGDYYIASVGSSTFGSSTYFAASAFTSFSGVTQSAYLEIDLFSGMDRIYGYCRYPYYSSYQKFDESKATSNTSSVTGTNITSLKFYIDSGLTIASGSTIEIYGVKK